MTSDPDSQNIRNWKLKTATRFIVRTIARASNETKNPWHTMVMTHISYYE